MLPDSTLSVSGFSTKHVDAGLDQRACDLVVKRRRHGDARGIDLADNAAIVEGRLGAELRGDGTGALRVGIDHGDQLCARVAGIVIGVKAAKIAGADDGDADLVCHGL